ncbi:L-threonine 3-dehydrogenase [Candidatus Bathyarchaeota archaeon]|nr:MAG: L-threonine 3-dehydrogenase [Candidatus Bathyarchaeota archaeon]
MVRTRIGCLEAPRKITIKERDIEITEDQVLVKVYKAYICGSELHYYRGKYPPYVKLPIYPGHEGGGTIVEVGSKVTEYSVGDKVIVYSDVLITPSGADPLFSDYVRAPLRCLQRVPEGVDMDTACQAEPLSCAVDAIYKSGVELGDVAVVIGLGYMGQVILQGIKKLGAGTAIGVDIVESKLKLAERRGADLTINAREEDPVERVLEETDGKGADVVIEAVGTGKTVNQAASMLKKGGILGLFGWVTRPVEIDLSQWHTKYLRPRVLKIPSYREKMPWAERGFQLIKQGILEVKSQITHEYRLANLAEAFRKYDTDPNVIKIAIKP